MRHLLILLLLAVMPLQALAQTQPAPERRVAFVVGIGAYQNAPKLANPVNDARGMRADTDKRPEQVEEVDEGEE